MAIKKRAKFTALQEPDLAERVEQFGAGAEGGEIKNKPCDPAAIRDYKAIRLPFNQYEFEQLEKASKLSGRSKLNFIRYAMLKLAKEIQEN